jgi:hypothetical protein
VEGGGGSDPRPVLGDCSAFSSLADCHVAKDLRRDRSHLRSAIASVVQSPVLKFPFLKPRGAPGLNPPCNRHRRRPRMAGRWQASPARVSAPQRGARLRFLRRTLRSWSMRLSANFCRPPSLSAAGALETRLAGDQSVVPRRPSQSVPIIIFCRTSRHALPATTTPQFR